MKLASKIFRRTDWYVTSAFGWRADPFTGKTSGHSGTDYGTYVQKWPQYAVESGNILSCGTDSNGSNALERTYPKCVFFFADCARITFPIYLFQRCSL